MDIAYQHQWHYLNYQNKEPAQHPTLKCHWLRRKPLTETPDGYRREKRLLYEPSNQYCYFSLLTLTLKTAAIINYPICNTVITAVMIAQSFKPQSVPYHCIMIINNMLMMTSHTVINQENMRLCSRSLVRFSESAISPTLRHPTFCSPDSLAKAWRHPGHNRWH